MSVELQKLVELFLSIVARMWHGCVRISTAIPDCIVISADMGTEADLLVSASGGSGYAVI